MDKAFSGFREIIDKKYALIAVVISVVLGFFVCVLAGAFDIPILNIPYRLAEFIYNSNVDKISIVENKARLYNFTHIGAYAIYWVAFLFPIHRLLQKIFAKKYLPCPYDDCNQSIKLSYKWLCDKCKNIQNKEHFITDKCDVCGQELETFFCEHCKREFEL